MATPRTTEEPPTTDDAALESIIEQDPNEPGRHNARFVEYGTHLWAVLGTWRRTVGDVGATAAEWGMPEAVVRAAIRYYERHRDLYDAYLLLQDEEWNAWNNR